MANEIVETKAIEQVSDSLYELDYPLRPDDGCWHSENREA